VDASPASPAPSEPLLPAWPVRLLARLGRRLFELAATARRLGSFTLITGATLAQKFGSSGAVIRPLIRQQLVRCGIRLLPLTCFLGAALGLGIVGQVVQLLVQVGQTPLTGALLVTVVIRELAPLTVALVVLARVGTAMVAELGTARALGEVEALEALGVDPIHYLVVPRVVGVTLSVFGLSVYLLLCALAAGYVFAFLRGLPLRPGDFFALIANALSWVDFPLFGLKTLAFGVLISLVICYHGLARPLRLEEVGAATTRTVAQCVVACLTLDAFFIPVYLLL
jgi:phospholipid/cholesterol/gamma-HCH transport system permease protein